MQIDILKNNIFTFWRGIDFGNIFDSQECFLRWNLGDLVCTFKNGLGHVLFALFEKLVMKVRVEIPQPPFTRGENQFIFFFPLYKGD
jgi:hypothetical protein